MVFKQSRKINRALAVANTYEEWQKAALIRDRMTGMDKWRKEEYSDLYDFAEIKLRLRTLRNFRKNGDDVGLLFTLNEGIHGNMGGMGKAILYNKALSGTKQLIIDYVDEVADALWHLAKTNNPEISFKDKRDFFRRASICFGRSALMLSGGGQLGNFHIGVLKALAKEKLLPNVISGASAGSLFAALVGTHTDEELVSFLEKEELLVVLKKEAIIYENIVNEEKTVKTEDLQQIINSVIPDLTFQEAYEKTGRKINISIAPHGAQQKSRLLNAIASPNVLMRSALMASCAIPGIFPPVTLYAKNRKGEKQPYLPSRKWVDGSMSNDLPSKRLSRLYGVNHFIVSLTNPVVLPFVSDPSTQNPLFSPVRKLGATVLKETTQFNYSMAKHFFRFLPKSMTLTANTINSIVQQEYIGDINIIADFTIAETRKILSTWSFGEFRNMIKKGERATWPKIEAIRVTTKIGNVLDEIIEGLKEEIVNIEERA